MSSAQQNLSLAVAAMRFANSRIKLQSNQVSDIVLSFGKAMSCVADMREARSQAEQSWYRSFMTEYRGMHEREIRKKSERDYWERRYMIMKYQMLKAIQHGCGNCGELSSTAFFYMLDKKTRPIEKMFYKGGDHAFCVVGRRSDSREADPRTWGAAAAICDPWNEVACMASEHKSKLPSIGEVIADPNQSIASWYRLEGPGPLPQGL
jgi:hypothetical protein